MSRVVIEVFAPSTISILVSLPTQGGGGGVKLLTEVGGKPGVPAGNGQIVSVGLIRDSGVGNIDGVVNQLHFGAEGQHLLRFRLGVYLNAR